LAFMTVLSVVLGYAAPLLLPREITHYAAVALFFFFGSEPLNAPSLLRVPTLCTHTQVCSGTSCSWRRERLKMAKSKRKCRKLKRKLLKRLKWPDWACFTQLHRHCCHC
jgi:hypothetical protein